MVCQVLEFAVVGFFVGAMSRLLKPRKQHLKPRVALLLGVAGALAGAVLAHLLGTGPLFELNLTGFLIASTASALLISVPNTIAAQRTPGP
jgi:uncharacterized membrane protein YeaQ/YmgE (transglycosylase-associated protein family)